MTRKSLLLIAVLLTAAASSALGEVMYARTTAEVRAGRTLSALSVARLQQGDAVNVLERAGNYYRVSVGGKEGWVYYNKLAAQKPEDVAALLALSPSAGAVSLAEIEAGGALRGLSPTAQNYARQAALPDWAVRAVERAQALSVSDRELAAFAREGRLGEYGEEAGR